MAKGPQRQYTYGMIELLSGLLTVIAESCAIKPLGADVWNGPPIIFQRRYFFATMMGDLAR
jgi:hypothetical protein